MQNCIVSVYAKTLGKALLLCLLSMSFSVFAAVSNLSAYKTDGILDMAKVNAAIQSGSISADQAVVITRQLVDQAPGLAVEITAMMATAFPQQAQQIRSVAVEQLMVRFEAETRVAAAANRQQAASEEVSDNKLQLAATIAFTSGDTNLQKTVVAAALRSQRLGQGGVSAIVNGVRNLSDAAKQQVVAIAQTVVQDLGQSEGHHDDGDFADQISSGFSF